MADCVVCRQDANNVCSNCDASVCDGHVCLTCGYCLGCCPCAPQEGLSSGEADAAAPPAPRKEPPLALRLDVSVDFSLEEDVARIHAAAYRRDLTPPADPHTLADWLAEHPAVLDDLVRRRFPDALAWTVADVTPTADSS